MGASWLFPFCNKQCGQVLQRVVSFLPDLYFTGPLPSCVGQRSAPAPSGGVAKGQMTAEGKQVVPSSPTAGGKASGIMWSPTPAKQKKKKINPPYRAPSPFFYSTTSSGCLRVATGGPDDPVQGIRIWEGQHPESERPSLTVIRQAHLTIFLDTGLHL